jgi:hypothetical protein
LGIKRRLADSQNAGPMGLQRGCLLVASLVQPLAEIIRQSREAAARYLDREVLGV